MGVRRNYGGLTWLAVSQVSYFCRTIPWSRIRLLEIKFALRYPNYKVIFQPGSSGWNDIIPLEYCPKIDKIVFVFLR